MRFNRGYDKLLDCKDIIVIEDIVTTGQSVMKTIKEIEYHNGHVIGVVSIWNRSDVFDLFNKPHYSIISEYIESYNRVDCPMCQMKIDLTDPKTGNIII